MSIIELMGSAMAAFGFGWAVGLFFNSSTRIIDRLIS